MGLLTILCTTIAVTLLIHLVPGDPVQIMYAQSQGTTPEQLEQIRHSLGLDRSIAEQYVMWWRRLKLGHGGLVVSRRLLGADRHGDVSPCCDSVRAKLPMICGGQMFAVKKEEISDLTMD